MNAAPSSPQRAVVLLSGGLDSTTVLAIARAAGYDCACLSFDYGQRHRAELQAAKRIANALGAYRHQVVQLDLRPFAGFGGSALTDESIAVPTAGLSSGIPVTYVPARNTIMLAIALGFAEVNQAQHIFFGANAVDYSGYPDCRPAYVQAFSAMANLATKAAIEGQLLEIHTPIIHATKAEIIQQGHALGVDYGLTVSCYQANDAGEACGVCDSCRLRKIGFQQAGLADPTRYQSAQ
ncbi:7-cyano-7-deazaguanine synthase QueC [Parvibium lacunae]|uniref:7-cyano-7-deazaguanine synthase n=1 Tax=Parvibium lacunae TaxID=1888893 RepID=A0A368L3E6_9BURK|nr:7-cyano-7-deazaguanine synthase QueC [Parvibium lacunae]RCS58111.1 7-cyano-7-deazaguanine synthase QueC [Parvibium lacunae]